MDTLTKPILVINADDFGWFEQRDTGIIEAFETGAISSTTAIANGNYLEKSLQKIKDKDYGVGLHLNLTDGPPVYKENLLKNSLIGKYMWYPNDFDDQIEIDGFHGLFPLHSLVKSGKISDVDLENEIRAQISRFIILRGKLPTHIDGHKHIQMIPQVAIILGRIMTREFGIYRVRISFDENENLSKDMQGQYEESTKIYQSYGISSTSYFFGKFGNGKFTKDNIIKCLNNFKSKMTESDQLSVEMMCHVGYPSVNPPKCFSSSQQRVKELRILQDTSLQDYINSNYILASFDKVEAKLPSADKSVRELFQISKKSKIILSSCNMVEGEDCLNVLDSIANLLNENKYLYFIQGLKQFFDSTYLTNYVNKLTHIKESNPEIKDRIIYIHTLNEQQFIKSLKDVDIFLSYSPLDSSSEQLLKAMTHGTVCISKNTKFISSIIQDQVSGFLFNEFKEMETQCTSLLQDKFNTGVITQNAYKISQNYHLK